MASGTPLGSGELSIRYQGGDARQHLVVAGQLEAIACWILQAGRFTEHKDHRFGKI